MRKKTVLRDYRDMSDKNLLPFTEGVIQAMTANAFYPEVEPLLTDLSTKYNAYRQAIPSRNLRNSVNSAAKNALKAQVIETLDVMASYVNYEAMGNVEELESTGFRISGDKTGKGLVGQVDNVTLRTNGIEGLIVAKCQRDANADLYQARASVDGINWQWMGASRTSTVKIFNCPVDVSLQVQMRCENKHGVSPWSTPVLAKIGAAGTIASMHNS